MKAGNRFHGVWTCHYQSKLDSSFPTLRRCQMKSLQRNSAKLKRWWSEGHRRTERGERPEEQIKGLLGTSGTRNCWRVGASATMHARNNSDYSQNSNTRHRFFRRPQKSNLQFL